MKIAFLVSILLFSFISHNAQETCGLKNSPALLGLRIGMSPEQAQSVFGRDLKIKFKTRDEKTIFENYINKSAPPSLSGVRALYLRFFEQRLYQIEVFYEDTNSLKTLGDFTNSLVAKWSFPASTWQEKNGEAIIDCENFVLVAHKTLNPHIELTDKPVRDRVEKIRKEKSGKK